MKSSSYREAAAGFGSISTLGVSKLRRLSVLTVESDAGRSLEIAGLLRDLGVRDVVRVHKLAVALEWLKGRAPDVLICAERLDDGDGPALVEAARQVSPATRSLVLPEDQGRGPSSGGGFGRLELSAWGVMLQVFLNGAVAPRGGFWCDVPDLSLCDVLQLYHQLRRTITVLLSGPIAGYVRLEAGELVDAASEDLVGVSALTRLLEAKTGLLRTDLSAVHYTPSIGAPFQRVILDALEQIDERRQSVRVERAVVEPSALGVESRPDSKSGTDLKRRPDSKSGIELKSRPDSKSGIELKSRPHLESGIDLKSGIDLRSRPDSKSGIELKSRPDSKSGIELNAVEAKAAVEAKSAVGAEGRIEATNAVEVPPALPLAALSLSLPDTRSVPAAGTMGRRPSPVLIAASVLIFMVLVFALAIYFAKRSERLSPGGPPARSNLSEAP